MNLSFENKVALVTGAGAGMGLAAAQAFAAEGRPSFWRTSTEKQPKQQRKKLPLQAGRRWPWVATWPMSGR